MISTKGALVLAGGGVAGIAWETGFLLGLQDEAPGLVRRLLTHSTTLVGTSAGSTVAAQIATGNNLQQLFDRQVAAMTAERIAVIDLAQLGGMVTEATKDAASPEQARQRLGTLAREADTPPAAVRRAVIEARLTTHEWSDWPLLIPAIDTSTGELRVFDNTSGTNLVDVVAASCAVPAVWPPVEIEGRLYMDGGARSLANADLAAGAAQVLILVPSPAESSFGVAVSDEQLRALDPARVRMINADAASLKAMGANPLDPESRTPAAQAGRDQGRRLAAEVDTFWS
ncbi:patatin-like phospholipase family protein [Arthrobacter sp. MI7-26]|uniref:patatin-like phospholipase family protein n=1 Tax=Arthrobacter sp. MI7-26 TaxID=2993653 RepID=UPI0022497298|nr:patatin-like phospholipase family protein [Arthrobacter sp. MI7-26]MCX2748902.1 patatin-like phospholipase family protein [Arthrobacter sp. MI7-26]